MAQEEGGGTEWLFDGIEIIGHEFPSSFISRWWKDKLNK